MYLKIDSLAFKGEKCLKTCAKVAIDARHPSIKKEYIYLIPEELAPSIARGAVVQVPFNKVKVDGIVTEVLDSVDNLDFRLRKIIKQYPFNISSVMMQIGVELSRYYGTALIDILKLMLPPQWKMRCKTVFYAVTKSNKISSRAFRQKSILDLLINSGPHSLKSISKKLNISLSSASSGTTALVKKGFVKKKEITVKNKLKNVPIPQTPHYKLSNDQIRVIDIILQNYMDEKKNVLLYGVTGSGKTEVYIQCIKEILQKGKRALLLVPEISLTPQMSAIFYKRFPGKVAILHSRLSLGARSDEWFRIYENDAKVIIGARSAVFAPIDDLGIIIIDEEHEGSYKQFDYPYYDARKVAEIRAKNQNAMLVLGSATPSVESYYKAVQGKYLLTKLTKRVSGQSLPQIEAVDMRQEMKAGHYSIFSRQLLKEIKMTLSRNKQIILFLNRRGHSTFVLCRDCGFVLKCPYCDISLTYHFNDRMTKCHYCGYQIPAPDICPKCKSRKIRYFGVGTQKVEQEVKKWFPNIKTLRVDSDSTSQKGVLEKTMASFRRGEAHVLVGTQSVAKGLDFPNVALVGVINADTALNMPDFRSEERTFQLITQVAGRAGRGHFPGKVYVQTYNPESFSITTACNFDISGFYNKEMQNRFNAKFPPFCHLLNIIFTGPREEIIEKEASKIKKSIRDLQLNDIKIYGPAPAPKARIRDNFRYNILVKSKEVRNLIEIQDFLKRVVCNKNIKIAWDMDPQDLM